ncbi:hypothetical protein BGZ82_001081 [Podila clonocystis]|nr:hypothetical protein BGZ82_001081 [Podila clonocystis]
MRLASYALLILGAVTATVLASPVRKLTLQELDTLAKENGKLIIEWNVAAFSKCGDVRAELASHSDIQDIDFVSLDYDTIYPENKDQVNTYQATIGFDIEGTYQGVNKKKCLIQKLTAAN